MLQRGEVDVGHAGAHDLGEALVEHRILRFRLVVNDTAVDR